MSRVLDVYLHDRLTGQLAQNETGQLSFQYGAEYLGGENAPVSLSMPLREEPYEGEHVRAFFSGLLPDDIVRHRLARYLGVSEKNPFALLEAIGGECAGALSLWPEGEKPPEETPDHYETLDEQKLQEMLELLKRRPLLAGEDGLRLSLAGAQDKIAVGVKDDQIALMRGTTPTTHILKPVIADIESSVHNELFCMRLAAAVGIEAPQADIRYAGETPYYLVARYDRVFDEKAGRVKRLHQEDFCQALGIMPDIKYEREGGPGVEKCQELLRARSARPAVDQLSFLERLIFNYLIGNADAHARNFSFLYKSGHKPELAPAYDLLSTAVYPDLSSKMAMKIGGTYKPNDVFLRHWHRLVPDTAAARRNLEKQMQETAKACLEKAESLKSDLEKEDIRSPVFDEILAVIAKRSEHLTDGF